MSRRATRRDREPASSGGTSGTPPVVPLFDQVLALSAGRPVFTASRYTPDGVSSRVRSFVDWNDATHTLDQPSGALQVALPVGGYVEFTATQVYQSNRPIASWTFASAGLDCEKIDIFTPRAVAGLQLVSTTIFTGGFSGSQLYFTGFADIAHFLGTPGYAVNAVPLGTATANVPTYTSLRHKAGASPEYELRQKSALNASGAFAAALTGSPPQAPLTLGSDDFPALVFPGNFAWAATLFTPALTPAQRSVVESWILDAYGVAP